MPWNLTADTPIYLQLVERMKSDIVAGIYAPGQKIPPVRELASLAGVNPNTMQRALSELEREGLLYSERTSGRFVSEDPARIREAKASQARELTAGYLDKMRSLGLDPQSVIRMITEQTMPAPEDGQGRN
ncbi:MAG: GntR family transcriptional regulator [Lachnospiraceae bacterium]|nr:GntR family transcriptional regulator [Lachnospiraceae bacterium]